jgi:hypothetical protein
MDASIVDPVTQPASRTTTADATVIRVSVGINKNGQGQCTPDPVPVPVGGGPVQLLFVLDASAQEYRFLASGAVAPVNQFPQPSVTIDALTEATLDNVASKKGQFPYNVQLQHAVTGEALVFRFDPMIENQA